ncbi:hypothetical protein LXL04_007961 [Taraxacum kok-saghyz]
MYNSLLHYFGKWLLGTANLGSSVASSARQWISRTDPKKTCWVRFNLQEMVPIVFGGYSHFGHHVLDVISSMKCPSLCLTFPLQNASPSWTLIITRSVHYSKNSYCLGRPHNFGSQHRFGNDNQSHRVSATPSTPNRSHRSCIHPSEDDQSIPKHTHSRPHSPLNPQPFPGSGSCIAGNQQSFITNDISAERLSLMCSEVPYPPHISIADASVEDKFRRRNPKPALRQASDSDNLVIRPPLLEGIAPSAVFFFRDFSAAWRFNCLSVHCSSEVPYPPQISIADASVEDKFRRHNPKPALRKWLLGVYDVDSSATCQVRQWFSRIQSTNAWPFRFNLQEMSPIVFGDRSSVRRHASGLIPMECPSLTRSIRSDPKPVVGDPLHPRPFIVSGTCTSGTSQPILHLVADLQIGCLLRCLCSHTYDLLSTPTYQRPFFNQIASHGIASLCLNMSQQQQHVYPNQNMNLIIHIPCLLQERLLDVPIPFLTSGDL